MPVEPRDSMAHSDTKPGLTVEANCVVWQRDEFLGLSGSIERCLHLGQRVVDVVGRVGHDEQGARSDEVSDAVRKELRDLFHRLERDVRAVAWQVLFSRLDEPNRKMENPCPMTTPGRG